MEFRFSYLCNIKDNSQARMSTGNSAEGNKRECFLNQRDKINVNGIKEGKVNHDNLLLISSNEGIAQMLRFV